MQMSLPIIEVLNYFLCFRCAFASCRGPWLIELFVDSGKIGLATSI